MARKTDEKFPWRHRLVKGSDYRLVYKQGRRVDAGKFVLFGCPNELDCHRLGLTVSRKVGCAVVRNRIKRLFREIFRRFSADIPCHFDLVVNAKRGCDKGSFDGLRDDFLSAARKICRC